MTPEPTYPDPAPYTRPPTLQERAKKFFAPLGAIGAGLLKYGALLFKLKFFTLFASMLVSVLAYATFYGWRFALGFVLLIFVHEMGHVIVLRMRGIRAGLPVFLPFLGAVVNMKESPRSAYDEALSGIAGPAFGTAGAFAVLVAGQAYDSPLLKALAYVGLLLNLFNLLPFLPLDGGRTAAAISPKLWIVGLIGLLTYEIYRPSPIIPLILVFGGIETYRRWKGRDSDASKAYYNLSLQQRVNVGTGYAVLVAVILWGMHAYPLAKRS